MADNRVFNEVCDLINCVADCLKTEMANGCCNVDTTEAGEVADILKDLTEAKKNLKEAEYYELVSDAMQEKTPERRMYYTHDINTAMPSFKPMVDQKNYIRDYLDNPNEFKESMYGREYDAYRRAKRHYTETDKESYKVEMDEHAMKHIDNLIDSVKEMWADADPTHRSKMKSELTSLISSM